MRKEKRKQQRRRRRWKEKDWYEPTKSAGLLTVQQVERFEFKNRPYRSSLFKFFVLGWSCLGLGCCRAVISSSVLRLFDAWSLLCSNNWNRYVVRFLNLSSRAREARDVRLVAASGREMALKFTRKETFFWWHIVRNRNK